MTDAIKELLPNIQDHRLFSNYDFRLIGGTALSYHINHRLSEDLDFCFNGNLPRAAINDFLLHCVDVYGHDEVRAIPFTKGKITDFEKADEDIRDYEQSWSVYGVRVTFFDGSSQTGLWDILDKDNYAMIGNIKVTSADSIFMTKSLTFYNRAKARDYFDVLYMIAKQDNCSVERLVGTIQKYELAYRGEGINLFFDKLKHIPYDKASDEPLYGLVDVPEDYHVLKEKLVEMLNSYGVSQKKMPDSNNLSSPTPPKGEGPDSDELPSP